MPIDAPIVVTPLAVTMREWIKKILHGKAVNYADGLRNKKNPAGGVNYCWIVDTIDPHTLANITELAALSQGHDKVSIKLTTLAHGCAPGKAYNGGIYVRCKVRA